MASTDGRKGSGELKKRGKKRAALDPVEQKRKIGDQRGARQPRR